MATSSELSAMLRAPKFADLAGEEEALKIQQQRAEQLRGAAPTRGRMAGNVYVPSYTSIGTTMQNIAGQIEGRRNKKAAAGLAKTRAEKEALTQQVADTRYDEQVARGEAATQYDKEQDKAKVLRDIEESRRGRMTKSLEANDKELNRLQDREWEVADARQKQADALELANLKLKQKSQAAAPKPGQAAQQKYIEANRLLGRVDEIGGQYESMKNQEQIDQPIKQAAVSLMWAPLQRIAESTMYDNEGENFFATGNRFASRLSQLASGMAVTGYEFKDREQWSPFAKGLTPSQRKERMDAIRGDLQSEVDAFEGYYGEGYRVQDAPTSGDPTGGNPWPEIDFTDPTLDYNTLTDEQLEWMANNG